MPGSKPIAEDQADMKVEGAGEIDTNGANLTANVVMRLVAEGGDLDAKRVYKWSEACEISETYCRMVVKMTGDPRQRTRNGRRIKEYLVKWVGYEETTWVCEDDLNCTALLFDYDAEKAWSSRKYAAQDAEEDDEM